MNWLHFWKSVIGIFGYENIEKPVFWKRDSGGWDFWNGRDILRGIERVKLKWR